VQTYSGVVTAWQQPKKPAPNRRSFQTSRIPRRERAENPKTILKTTRRNVRTLNTSANFRMVDTHATPFLGDRPSGTPAWHNARGRPRPMRKRRHCRRNHRWRPLASARLGSGASQARWPAADSAANATGSTPGHITDRSTSCGDRARRRRSRSYLSRSGRDLGNPFGHRTPTSPPHPSSTP